MAWIISPLVNQGHNLNNVQNKMKFGIKCPHKMLKKENIVRITFSDTEITLLQKQQLNVKGLSILKEELILSVFD